MSKRAVLTGSISVLLMLAMLGAQSITPVGADPATIRVPENYATIQDAVNAANPGDTIRVASGTYYENVAVNKRVNLLGQDRENTIIDGSANYHVVRVTGDDVRISGFTIRNGMGGRGFYYGIVLYKCGRAVISGNILVNNFKGIGLDHSSGNVIWDNVIRDNQYGIWMSHSSGNTIRGNTVKGNWLYGISLSDSSENVVAENTVEPSTYYKPSVSIRVTSYSERNTIYRNNFIGKPNLVEADSVNNAWDNGAEGNHWSDYQGVDDGSGGRVAGDGVGDTLLPHLNVDHRPLMEPWSSTRIFDVPPWGKVTIVSNSTIASFNFNLGQISFRVTAPPGTTGFCNVTIPIELRSGILMIQVDGVPVDYTWTQNATHFSLCFNCNLSNLSTRKVEIFDILNVLLGSWLKRVGDSGYDRRADLKPDGAVDGFDLATLGRYWWKTY